MRPCIRDIALAALLALIWLSLIALAQAVSLEISGHIAGQGMMNSSFVGDSLNVSLFQNATGLNITVVGGAA